MPLNSKKQGLKKNGDGSKGDLVDFKVKEKYEKLGKTMRKP